MEPYCPECGRNHPTYTACPYQNSAHIVPNMDILETPIEKKLDKIIELLEHMEYHLRTLK